MIGLGTLINVAGVVVGGFFGLLFGGMLKKNHQDSLSIACGISTMFIGTAGAMKGMLSISNGSLGSSKEMVVVLSLALGAFVGEIIDIEGWFERFGEWLKVKSGNAKDNNFVNAFLTASLTVCIGAMAIVGSIQDGIFGDYSILMTKSILDLIIIMIMTSSLGKGCIFSAIPILFIEGSITLLSRLIMPIMTDAALFNLSLVGSVMIFCVGVNLVWGKKIRVANFLPGIVFAVIFSFLPFAFLG